MATEKHILLSIGSNLGDRKKNIEKAIRLLDKSAFLRDLKISNLYQTEPYGFKEQPHFLNNVISFNTNLSPKDLLYICRSIETSIGRLERGKWQPREIDLDILLYDSLIYNIEQLKIPHPEMHLRKFVLVPACEIEPDTIHPVYNKTIKQLLNECFDISVVYLYCV